MRVEYLTNAFPKFLESHGLRRMRFHDLRHSCASLLLANRRPPQTHSGVVGAQRLTTTRTSTPTWITSPRSLRRRRWRQACSAGGRRLQQPLEFDQCRGEQLIFSLENRNRAGLPFKAKLKACKRACLQAFCGGELGIRTLETFRSTAFRVLHLRPLGQLSVSIFVRLSFQKFAQKFVGEKTGETAKNIRF